MANSDPVNANGSTEICEMTKLVKEIMIRITSLEQTVKCQVDTIRILKKKTLMSFKIVCRPKKILKQRLLDFQKLPN